MTSMKGKHNNLREARFHQNAHQIRILREEIVVISKAATAVITRIERTTKFPTTSVTKSKPEKLYVSSTVSTELFSIAKFGFFFPARIFEFSVKKTKLFKLRALTINRDLLVKFLRLILTICRIHRCLQ